MKANKVPWLIVGIVLLLGIAVASAYSFLNLGKSSPMVASGSNDHTGSQAAEVNEVTIQQYSFEPMTVKVKVGTKVTWTNKDSVAHTVTAQDGAPAAIDSGLFGKNKSYSFTFTKSGTYNYYCQPHPYMKGTVIVTE